ncbi:hypothetical protein B0J14DRAFT_657687 [Halenospora varia]|nr:hypothetical protein B0J14DRAFT_657687 [Halenospora varia]
MAENDNSLTYLFLVDYTLLPESKLHGQAVAAGISDEGLEREGIILALLDYDAFNHPGYISHFYWSGSTLNWRNDLYSSIRREKIHDQFNFDFSQARQRKYRKVARINKMAEWFKHLKRRMTVDLREEERAYFEQCQRLRATLAAKLARLERIREREKEEKQAAAREENAKTLVEKRRKNRLENEERINLGLTFKKMDELVAKREDEQRLARVEQLKMEDEDSLLEARLERVEHDLKQI